MTVRQSSKPMLRLALASALALPLFGAVTLAPSAHAAKTLFIVLYHSISSLFFFSSRKSQKELFLSADIFAKHEE